MKQENIDVKENCLYIVRDGIVTMIDAPISGHGEYEIIWKDGKILDVIKSERMRINQPNKNKKINPGRSK